MFSSITQQFDVPSNRLYRLRDGLLRKKRRIVDLVSGNVNTQGIVFPQEILAQAMRKGVEESRVYRPDPLGQLSSRKAISRYYAAEGLAVPPGQLILTPGTSISYWYAFKLLADPGDDILCPTPSYPLFDTIAALSGIQVNHYKLKETTRWEIDFDQLRSVIGPRTKAIVLISPHNPTGSVATADEVKALAKLAEARGLAIIADEVFSPFLYGMERLPRPTETSAPLVITLNGLSKMLALPGIKIGWMAVTGDPALVGKSIKSLEMISDAFLPVNEAAQFSVSGLLRHSAPFLKRYASEMQSRLQVALEILQGHKGISLIPPEGGFFLALRLEKAGADEEEIACRLLQKHGILVHPGYFYDMEGQHLVFSFVSRPAVLRMALQCLLREI